MANKMQQIFYTTLVVGLILLSGLFYFFHQTGDKYLMKDYTYYEGLCFPGNNVWYIEKCILTMVGVIPDIEPRKCYYNKNCDIYFVEPKTYPIWFWLIFIVIIFVLTWTGPSPSNMRHWKGDYNFYLDSNESIFD